MDSTNDDQTVVEQSQQRISLPTRRRRIVTRTTPRILWYTPSANRYYAAIALLERTILTDNDGINSLYTSWTLPSRTYYAVLFFVYIIHVRMKADVATPGEREAYASIDTAHNIRNLPIDGSLVNALRLAVPYRQQTGDTPALYPEQSRFLTVHNGSRLRGTFQIGDVMIPLSYINQPTPRILAHLNRWIYHRYKSNPEPPIPNKGDIIRTLVYGAQPDSDLIDQFIRMDMLNVLFNNPALKHPLAFSPMDVSAYIGLSSSMQVPPRIEIFCYTDSEKYHILNELANPHTSEWFSFAKMAASSQTCISGDPEIFSEVMVPLAPHEIEDGIEQIEIPPDDSKESDVDFSPQWTDFINI